MKKSSLYAVPDPPGLDGETKAMRLLRQKARQIKTRAQFESILSDGNTDNQIALRKLIEPLLRPDLPCCGKAQLARRLGKNVQHSAFCPENKLVML